MGYYQPLVIYRNINDKRENSIIRYIGNRVLKKNTNALIAIVGSPGKGKSYLSLAMAEIYSKMFSIPFNPKVHVISSLKELLLLITRKDVDKLIQERSVIVFDEPQVEANSRNWQSEINQAFSQLISTFRNQRLVVFFATPYIEMLDKQSRILFTGEFLVEGFNENTKITTVKPRFLEYNKNKGDFFRKRLIVKYKSPEKDVLTTTKINSWHVHLASKDVIDIYEQKKKKFSDDLNIRLLNQIELSEKQAEGKNKSDEFNKVRELYDKYGEDYEKIIELIPYLSPFAIEKYIYFIKKSRKMVIERRVPENQQKMIKKSLLNVSNV